MKLALLGYGKMGRTIQSLALGRGHGTASFDPHSADADYPTPNPELLKDCSVCIDFSQPDSALTNMAAAAAAGRSIVVGTTGWYDHLDQAAALAAQSGIGILYAANFSIGVNFFYAVVRSAAQLANKLDSYDAAGIEYHHDQKLDSPSGTAKTLADILLQNIDRKETAVFDRVNRRIEPGELHFASVRCGSHPGTHEILFDSEADTITLKHTALSRSGFALGAVLAAEWLATRSAQKGGRLYSIEDFLQELFA